MKLHLTLLLLGIVLTCSSVRGQTGPADPAEVSQMTSDTNKVWAWLDVSKARQREDLQEAYSFADSARQLAVRLDFAKGEAAGERQLGGMAYYGGNFPEALDHYQRALEYYQRQGDELNAAKMINNQGLIFRNQGQIDSAMYYFFASLEVKERLGDTSSMAYSYNTIGETFAMRDQYDQAESFFGKALLAFRQTDNAPMVNGLKLNLGGFLRERGEPEKAIGYIREALEYFEVNGPRREEGRAYYILGGLYLDQGNWAESSAAYQTSQEIFESLGAQMRVLGCILRRSELAAAQGNRTQALELAREGARRARELGTREQEALALQILIDIHKKEGNYRSALQYTEQFHAVMDSVINAETNRSIAELEKKYESERKERELAELSATNRTNELSLARQKQVQRLLILVVIFIAVIALLLFNQFREKQRTNRLLMEKNRVIQASLEEKEVLLREIHHRVKNNLQFISSMLSLQTRHVADEKTRQVLQEGNHRINSMALVHQKLYQEDNLTGVDMPTYISNLVDTLRHAYRATGERVEVTTRVDPIMLDVDTVIPIGLILNELITNAFKHAFPDKEGQLEVSLEEREEKLFLQVSDNGEGLPEGFEWEQSEQFGFELITSLASKLKAEVETRSDNGLTTTLVIKRFKKS